MEKNKNPKIISYCIADKKVKSRNVKSPDVHVKTVVMGAEFMQNPAKIK
jgi:hypothetical protein